MSLRDHQIELPDGHEVIYQDEDLVISLLVEDGASLEDQAQNVFFWIFGENEGSPLRWDLSEDKEIILEVSEDTGESFSMLKALSEDFEPFVIPVSARAASMLSRRFKLPQRAIKGPRLGEYDELLYEQDGMHAVLHSLPPDPFTGQARNSKTVSIWDKKWQCSHRGVWLDHLDEVIRTETTPQGQVGCVTLTSPEFDPQVFRIPIELAKILADRFGKNLYQSTDLPKVRLTPNSQAAMSPTRDTHPPPRWASKPELEEFMVRQGESLGLSEHDARAAFDANRSNMNWRNLELQFFDACPNHPYARRFQRRDLIVRFVALLAFFVILYVATH